MSADPWPLAVLLHTVGAPNKRQELGWVNPPALVWSPDQEEHLRAAWQGDAIRATDVPDLHAGRITHARPAATLAVAQGGQQSPQWVVCMLSSAVAHIVVCDPERLPGPKAVVRVADCTRMIVKVLREGEHHALLLQVRLKDNARAARPGVWPAAAHPADLELQLAVQTAVYHWLPAFHDLRWRGNPDRQIGATHWQAWLQTDAQRDAVRSLGPVPATQALDTAAPGRALAPHTVPLANPPFEPAPEGAIQKSVPLTPARGASEPGKCPLCADKYYTSGAMLEHLTWHAVQAAAPVNDKDAASNILQGRAQRSLWHAPYARRPRPRRPTTQTVRRRHPERPREPAVRPNKGPSPRGWPPWPPSGPRWERAPRTPWPWRTREPWLPQRTQRQCSCGTADSRRTRRTTPYGSSHGTCATASSRQTGPSGTRAGGARDRRPVPTRSTSSPACYPGKGALPSCSRKQGSPAGAGDARGRGAPGQGVHPLLQQPASGDWSHFHLERGDTVSRPLGTAVGMASSPTRRPVGERGEECQFGSGAPGKWRYPETSCSRRPNLAVWVQSIGPLQTTSLLCGIPWGSIVFRPEATQWRRSGKTRRQWRRQPLACQLQVP